MCVCMYAFMCVYVCVYMIVCVCVCLIHTYISLILYIYIYISSAAHRRRKNVVEFVDERVGRRSQLLYLKKKKYHERARFSTATVSAGSAPSTTQRHQMLTNNEY